MKLYEKTAAELSAMLRNKQCSALEIYRDVKARISEVEPKIGAYITLAERGEITARAVDAALERGERLHPLAGIPVAIKDNISTCGLRTSCASKMLADYIPPFNATAVERLNDVGMIVTGKTNMDEFAMGSTTETSYFHATRNPHNTGFSAGGSSGGSAAAVSTGEALLALGSDTGGSVRQPAALCGVIGMKPTYGRVSRYGLIAYASSLEQIGVIGRSVADTALLMSLIGGYDAKDATSLKIACPDYCGDINNSFKVLRIGVPEEYFGDEIDDEVRESVFSAIEAMERNGARVRKISLPSTKYAVNAYYIIACAEASSNLSRYDGIKYGYRTDNFSELSELYERTRSEGFGEEVKRRIMLGVYVLSSGYYDKYYKRAKLTQRKIAHEFSQAFKECDVIATPTYPTAAIKLGEKRNNPLKMYSSDICTVSANIAGLPAISLPCGKSRYGMPIGIQLMGARFAEQTLFDAASFYEKICGGFNTIVREIG